MTENEQNKSGDEDKNLSYYQKKKKEKEEALKKAEDKNQDSKDPEPQKDKANLFDSDKKHNETPVHVKKNVRAKLRKLLKNKGVK